MVPRRPNAPGLKTMDPASRLLLASAQRACAAGELDEAADTCAALFAAHPDDLDVLLLVGAVALARGDGPAAVQALTEVARRVPENAGVWNNLGVAHQRQGAAA